MKLTRLTLDTLQSKTAEFESIFFFFPNQHSYCFFFVCFFFTSGRNWQYCSYCVKINPWIFTVLLRTSGRSRGQLSCSLIGASDSYPLLFILSLLSSSSSSLECELAAGNQFASKCCESIVIGTSPCPSDTLRACLVTTCHWGTYRYNPLLPCAFVATADHSGAALCRPLVA